MRDLTLMTSFRRGVIIGSVLLVLAAAWWLLVVYGPLCSLCVSRNTPVPMQDPPSELSAPNPLPLANAVELEKMTWMDVRDRIKSGFTRVILPTGGIEQNGPFSALNKHDVIARAVSVRAAGILGNTIVAPVVSFVPEGNHNPPSGHMRYPGTISLSSDTFRRLLEDIITSLSLHGFKEIVVVGDSYGSQDDIVRVVAQRTTENSYGATVRYLSAFYNYDDVRAFIKERGFAETPESFHEELAFSLQLLAIDPTAIRYQERLAAGFSTLGGVSLAEKDALVALGNEILQRRAEQVAAAIGQK